MQSEYKRVAAKTNYIVGRDHDHGNAPRHFHDNTKIKKNMLMKTLSYIW